MAKSMVIREYQPGDLSRVSYLQMKIYTRQYHFKPIFEHYLLAGMAAFLKNPKGSNLWIVESNDQVIASIAVAKTGENQAYIRWFAVDESLQGQGIGKQLIEKAMDFCQKNHYTHIILWTVDRLVAARHLYKKQGFKITETKENFEWADERLIEEKWELHQNAL